MGQNFGDKQTLLVVDDDLHILEVMEARLSSGFLVSLQPTCARP
jgi:hypothetical protein